MTRFVPLKDLYTEHAGWKNPREFTGLDPKSIDELGAEIKRAGGIIDPPKVAKIKWNGSFINLVVDGQRRTLAGEKVLPKNTEIEVVDLEDEPVELTPDKADELVMKALQMFNREPLSSYEISTVAAGMRARDKSLAEIAGVTGKSESWVSRMLKARESASPKLLLAWRKGEITDEQFKELAAQRDQEAQEKNTAEVIETRKIGNKAEARTKAKEIAETVKQRKAREKKEKLEAKRLAKEAKARAKAEAKAAKLAKKDAKKNTNGHGTANGHGTSEQQEMAWTPPPPVEKPKKTAPSKASLEEIVEAAKGRPPTHDYVKGVIAGVQHALGLVGLDELAKPWAAWISRLGGTGTAAKPAKRSYAAVRAAKKESKKIHAKADRARKAKAAESPKKRAAKKSKR